MASSTTGTACNVRDEKVKDMEDRPVTGKNACYHGIMEEKRKASCLTIIS